MLGQPITVLRLLHYGGGISEVIGLDSGLCAILQSIELNILFLCFYFLIFCYQVRFLIPQKEYLEPELTLTMV